VINAGVTGYNTIQERVRLEQIGPQFHPDLVLLTFVVNDLLDSFSVLDRQYEPRGILAPLKKWLRRNSHLYRFSQNTFWRLAAELRKDPDQPEPTRNRSRLVEREREIGRIAEISRERGAAFLLALYPDNLHQLVTADSAGRQVSVREHLMDFAAQMEIPVVDLTDALGDVRDQRARTMRLREDPHPSPAGHRAIAEALLEALRSQGLVGG
jgi:lysophospholipase L1-like esterase